MNGPPLPLALDHLAAAVVGNRMYVAGGFGPGGATDQVFFLAPSGREWVTAPPLHHARGGLALVALGESLYAIGGKDASGVEIPAVESYRIGAGSWKDVATLPLPRDHAAGFAYGGSVCVAGGRTPNVARIDCFDPRSDRWNRLPDLPVATSGAGAAVYRGSIVVGGGELAGEGGAIIDQLASFVGGRWRSKRMLLPRHGLQFAPYRGRIWACGGGTAPGLNPVPDCTSIGWSR